MSDVTDTNFDCETHPSAHAPTLERTLVGVVQLAKSLDFDMGTRPELEDVEYAYQTPSWLRMMPGSGKSWLMTAPLLTVRFTGMASERVETTPTRVKRRVVGNMVLNVVGGDMNECGNNRQRNPRREQMEGARRRRRMSVPETEA